MIAFNWRLCLCCTFVLVNSVLINALQFCAFILNVLYIQMSKLARQTKHSNGWYQLFIDQTQDAFLEVLYMTICFFAPQSRLAISWNNGDGNPWQWFSEDGHGMLISNHITYVDWMFIWIVFWHLQPADPSSSHASASGLKIVLKAQLKQVPVIGWGMQFFDFLFVARRWEADQSYLSQRLSKLFNRKQLWVLLFPEGTVVTPNTRSHMLRYAHKTGLVVGDLPKHVLLPRSTGLAHCLETFKSLEDRFLINNQQIPRWLLDVTIGYSELDVDDVGDETMTFGRVFGSGRATDVHLNLCRHHIDYDQLDFKEVAASDETSTVVPFSKWLNDVWREKDVMMGDFYSHKRFTAHCSKTIVISWHTLKLNSLTFMYEIWAVMIMIIWILSLWTRK